MRPIDRLDEAVKDLTSYIANLAPDKLEPSDRPQWGAREVFIHIVFWHAEYARITRERLNDQEARPLPGTHIDVNALAVEQYRDLPRSATANGSSSAPRTAASTAPTTRARKHWHILGLCT